MARHVCGTSKNNLNNNFYGSFFQFVQRNNFDLGHMRPRWWMIKRSYKNFWQSVQNSRREVKRLEWQLQSYLRYMQSQKKPSYYKTID